MKNYLLLLVCILLLTACGNEPKQAEGRKDLLSTDLVTNPHSAAGMDTSATNVLPVMDFADTVHNFGTIKEGEKVTFEYEFTNNGKTPLIISDAKGSCGCTVADYPRDPIAPGKSGKIKAYFDSDGKPGHQEKSVSVTTNTARSIHMLYIRADVERKK